MPTLLSKQQFDRVAETAYRHWGLNLTDRKIQLVSSRMQRFLRGSEFHTIDAYLDHITKTRKDEDLLAFFDLLSTNVTSFFREPASFAYLERELWTPLKRGTLTLPGRKIRMWSSACSTGQEPYTMAIHALEHLGSGWDVKILASDLANSAIEAAKAGVYDASGMKGMPPELQKKYFEATSDRTWSVSQQLRAMIVFQQVNLMSHWSHQGPFDVIFCRNVMIYFDRETRERLVRRLAALLRPGGILVIGSSETLSGIDVDLKPAQPSVYLR